jgi:hypothetical protein
VIRNHRTEGSFPARFFITTKGEQWVMGRNPRAGCCTMLTALFIITITVHCCESGGTGRRAGLRSQWVTVGVQVPPLAPKKQEYKVHSSKFKVKALNLFAAAI